MDVVRKLSLAPIFEGIPHDSIGELYSRGRDLSFEAGHPLFERGQQARELMILLDGVVELIFPVHIIGVSRDLTMETMQAGSVVAWSSLVSPYQFTLSARCASRCELTGISREVLEEFFEARPDVGYSFMRNLAGVIGRRLQSMHTLWVNDLQSRAMK